MILHKIENDVHAEHNFRKLIVVNHLDTVYDKTTWPRPSAILLASGHRIPLNRLPLSKSFEIYTQDQGP